MSQSTNPLSIAWIPYLLKLEGKRYDDRTCSSYAKQFSATQRFVPLAINHCGRRDPQLNSIPLEQFASLLMVTRAAGCKLLSGPKDCIVSMEGSYWVLVVQREFATQVLRAHESSNAAAAARCRFHQLSFRDPYQLGLV